MEGQIQVKVSLSPQLNDFLESRAGRLGVPMTQFVKYLIIKEMEKEDYPVFSLSPTAAKKAEKAWKNRANFVGGKNPAAFFDSL